MRRELDDFDHAMLVACAVNDPKALDQRRAELKAKLRHEPSAPPKPQWTREEMLAAAQRVVTSVITTGKLPPKPPVQ